MGGTVVEQDALLSRVPSFWDPCQPPSLHPQGQGHLLPGGHNPARLGLAFSFQMHPAPTVLLRCPWLWQQSRVSACWRFPVSAQEKINNSGI